MRSFVKKYGAPVIILLIVAGVIAAALVFSGNKPKNTNNNKNTTSLAQNCGPYRHDVTVTIKGHVFNTELAKTAHDFQEGLGGRPCITADEAMLFSFSKPGQYPFWMKDMKFPIDIIWIGADRTVAAAEINERPSTYPDKFVNKKPAQYVLEIKANLSKELHLGIGTSVSL